MTAYSIVIALWTLSGYASWRLWRRGRARIKDVRAALCVAGATFIFLSSLCLFAAACGYLWIFHRAQPEPMTRAIFQGIEYERIVERTPRAEVIHVVRIDLNAPGIAFQLTPGDFSSDGNFRATLTTAFLKQSGGQLAVNGSFFAPCRSSGLFDYYPHSGDPVLTNGYCVSQGTQLCSWVPGYRSLEISKDGKAAMTDDPTTASFIAISGSPLELGNADRRIQGESGREPRTCVALNAAGDKLMIIVVDGRQPNYSEGLSLRELGLLVRRLGGTKAINLDGGGSSTLAMTETGGNVRLLNSPCNSMIPGLERPVANQLAVFAQAIE